MQLLDHADDILGIIVDYIPAARKREKVLQSMALYGEISHGMVWRGTTRQIKNSYVPTHAVLYC